MGRELTSGSTTDTTPIGGTIEIASSQTYIGDYVRAGEMVPSSSPLVANSGVDGKYTSTESPAYTNTMNTDIMIGGGGKLVTVRTESAKVTVYTSTNGGISWTRKITTLASGGSFEKSGYINSRFLFWGSSGIIEVLADNSVVLFTNTGIQNGSLDWDGTQWISSMGGGNTISTSPNLSTWTLVTNRPANSYGVWKVGSNYVSTSSGGVISTTTTLGTVWTTRSTLTVDPYSGHKVNNILVFKYTSGNTFNYSSDGITFTNSTLAYEYTCSNVIYAGGNYFVCNSVNSSYKYSSTLNGTFTNVAGSYSTDRYHVATDGTNIYSYRNANSHGCAITAGATIDTPYISIYPLGGASNTCGNNIFQLTGFGSSASNYNSCIYRVSGETIAIAEFNQSDKYLSYRNIVSQDIYYNLFETTGKLLWTTTATGSILYQHTVTAGVIDYNKSNILSSITLTSHYAGLSVLYSNGSNVYNSATGTTLVGGGATSMLVSDNGNFICWWKTGANTQLNINGVFSEVTANNVKLFSKSGASVALVANTSYMKVWKIGNMFYTDNGSASFVYGGTRLDRMQELFATTITVSSIELSGLISDGGSLYSITPNGFEYMGSKPSNIIASSHGYQPNGSTSNMIVPTFTDSGLRRTAAAVSSITNQYKYIRYK